MRAPFQVLVFPYQIVDTKPRFLIARRRDNGVWQAISGGGEDNESLLEAAKRELSEESQLVGDNWQLLDSMCMLPKVFYAGNHNWTEHSFSVKVTEDPELSSEHTDYRWCDYREASELLTYDSNRNALWEINERLSC
ncbi:MutT/nudix family protein [Vibrio coralliirubri]|uniref:NUDIX hydrolase n=1 Tax=Vibrio coralliirubri TaxID=1516159 RepID=UPI0006361715|nr:NUDIX pyrophosphatase [Vibrio coralliirubri]CDT88937.1 MutT/nudix family protein [Vibrio coralliirubri]